MSKEIKLDLIIDTDVMIRKLDAIAKHTKALSDELKLIDSKCNCDDCSICLNYSFNQEIDNCNCKYKGECYKTLGEHGYKVTNCKGLVE